MNARKFLEAMNDIGDAYVEEALRYRGRQKKRNLLKWGVLAAGLALAVYGSMHILPLQPRALYPGESPHTELPLSPCRKEKAPPWDLKDIWPGISPN